MSATILVIEGIGLTPYSIRGVRQTLEPIEQSRSLERTVDGELDDLSLSQFRKYRSTISNEDLDAPALDGVFPGMQVTVHCIPELGYPLPVEPEDVPGEGAVKPKVSGSVRVVDGFVRYRPKLTMRVVSVSITRHEWAARTEWSISLEEV